MRVESLRIRQFQNVSGGTHLRFGKRGVILLGKNGTGKTTLLNLLVSLVRGEFSNLSLDDYDLDFVLETDKGYAVSATVKRESNRNLAYPNPTTDPSDAMPYLQGASSRIEVTISVTSPKGETTHIESSSGTTRYRYHDGSSEEISSSVENWFLLIPFVFAETQDAQHQKRLHLVPAFSEIHAAEATLRRFDEGLHYFRGLTERTDDSASVQIIKFENPDRYVPVTSRLLSGRQALALSEKLFERVMDGERTAAPLRDAQYLHQFSVLTGLGDAFAFAELDEKRTSNDRESLSLGPLRYFVETGKSLLSHRHLSFGQKRLLSFLHYLDSTGRIVVADELVNGMHHDWIGACLDLLKDRQAFLSSQNPLLFDFLTFDSVTDVEGRFVSCSLTDDGQFTWANMSPNDAEEFFETFSVGLQHVSEILRTRGYW